MTQTSVDVSDLHCLVTEAVREVQLPCYTALSWNEGGTAPGFDPSVLRCCSRHLKGNGVRLQEPFSLKNCKLLRTFTFPHTLNHTLSLHKNEFILCRPASAWL